MDEVVPGALINRNTTKQDIEDIYTDLKDFLWELSVYASSSIPLRNVVQFMKSDSANELAKIYYFKSYIDLNIFVVNSIIEEVGRGMPQGYAKLIGKFFCDFDIRIKDPQKSYKATEIAIEGLTKFISRAC